MNILLDETRSPSLREVIGRLMSAATHVDFAVANVRLAAIDVSEAETGRLQSCRFLLARLDARELMMMSAPDPARTKALHALSLFVQSGRVEIRSAGTSAWLPDFSIYSGLRGKPPGQQDACLVGAHYFHQPTVAGGPSLTCLMTGADATHAARVRFDALWDGAHDVGAVVLHTIEQALSE